jgi:hypothetical protein
MPNPTPGDVHVNRPLTNILIGYTQDPSGYVADRVFPIIPVQKQSDAYFTYGREDFWRSEITRERAPSSESEGGGYRLDANSTYYARVWPIHKDIDDMLRANFDEPINLDRDATIYVGQQLLLKKEKLWVSNYFTTSKWTGGTGGATDQTGVAGSPAANQFKQWNDPTSDPIEDITKQIISIQKKTGRRPNKLVLGCEVWYLGLLNHPDIIDRVKYTQTGMASPALLATLLGLDEVLIAGGIENTAAENLTGAYSFLLGKSALLVYANPNPGIMQPSGGYTFSWVGYLGAGNAGQRVKKFRVETINSDRIEGEMAFDQKLIAADCGCFFTAAVA